MSQILSLIFGFTILFLFSWFVIAISIYFYTKFSHKAKSLYGHILTASALLAFMNVFLISFGLIFYSFNQYVYPVVTFVLTTAAFFFVLKKINKQQNIDAIILGVSMALILNPGWLSLFGIL